MTLAGKMAAASNRPSGFDYMRLVLATAVIFIHSFMVIGTVDRAMAMWDTAIRPVFGLILPMFFALSGFLVAGSLERNKSLVSFLGLRAIRLAPALAVEVALSALILGPILTTVSLHDYVSSPLFKSYFLNILGDIHYQLPGVFTKNPFGPTVNAQLWTVPVELRCYLTLALLGAIGISARRSLLAILLGVTQLVIVPFIIWKHPPLAGAFPGKVLIGCFLAGLAIYKFREKIPSNPVLGLACIATTALLMLAPYGLYFISFPAAYAVIWLGTLNPPRHRFLLSGDYSYGLYLYGFPLQQAFTTLGAWTHVWWIDFLCVYPAAFAFAILSWWLVEKPATRLKRYIMTCEAWALRITPIAWHSEKFFVTRTQEHMAKVAPAAIAGP